MTIINGKDIPLNLSSTALPDMVDALSGLMQPVTFIVVTKSNIDGLVQELRTIVNTRAVREPYTPQRLAIMAEGERAWKWSTIHATADLILHPDDQIIWDGEYYRVMDKSDYKEYGYVQYEVVQDYQKVTPC